MKNQITEIEQLGKEIETLQSVHYDLIISEIERQARIILKRNPKRLKEFVMCMGMASFGNGQKNGPFYGNYIEREEFSEFANGVDLYDFIEKYDEMYKVKGHGFRFTATGPIVTYW